MLSTVIFWYINISLYRTGFRFHLRLMTVLLAYLADRVQKYKLCSLKCSMKNVQ